LSGDGGLSTKTVKNNVFVFYTSVYQNELTGETAKNLKEFVGCIKKIDDTSLFYHLYSSLLSHHFVPPEYPNDFAYWTADTLQEFDLAERLSSLDLGKTTEIAILRRKIVNIIEKHIKSNGSRTVPEGVEFHFLKRVIVILPTAYTAKNLKEFTGVLENIDTKSIFYHLFVSKLLLKRRVNDFSLWLERNGNKKAAEAISKIDPYDYRDLNDVRKKMVSALKEHKR